MKLHGFVIAVVALIISSTAHASDTYYGGGRCFFSDGTAQTFAIRIVRESIGRSCSYALGLAISGYHQDVDSAASESCAYLFHAVMLHNGSTYVRHEIEGNLNGTTFSGNIHGSFNNGAHCYGTWSAAKQLTELDAKADEILY